MASKEHRDLRKFEVAEYSYAQKRIIVTIVYVELEDALAAFDRTILDNEVPPQSAAKISEQLRTALLKGATLYEHECLATNSRVSFIIRK